MISKEFLEKAKACKSKEELSNLAKSEGIEINEDVLNKYTGSLEKSGALSDDELENVTGGTCYGDGWDGTSRPIVLHDNSCSLWTRPQNMTMSADVICANCQYYSYRVNEERISLVSAWCTHPKRIEGKDIIND